MLKRISLLLLISTILIMVSSCSPSSAYGVWKDMCDQYPNQKGKIQIISDNDEGDYHIEYEGVDYNIDKLKLFRVRESTIEIPEDDVLVSWNSFPLGIGYLDKYYSYTNDNPVFIYISRYDELYLRNDYNYETDTFVIEGSDKEFVFENILSLSNDFFYDTFSIYSSQTDITFHSKQYPRLKIQLRLFCVNNIWYAGGDCSDALFVVSNEFLDMLDTDLIGSTG